MITLGGIVLNNSMVWQERYGYSPVAQTMRRTLGGFISKSAVQLIAGRPITLISSETFGWLSLSTVEQLLMLAEDPLGTYTLSFNDVVYNVAFRHSEPPAVDFTPFVPRTADAPTDMAIGTIKLITL